MNDGFLRSAACVAVAAAPLNLARAHDIYSGVHDKTGQLCCGGGGCAATSYRESGGRFEFLTCERRWVQIQEDRITFLPIPGDKEDTDTHRAQRYRAATETDRVNNNPNVFEDIRVFCAFIPPGSI